MTARSDDNTITVEVSGAKFDLHISCSDDFADGYGDKGGPYPNQSPPQYPVHKWRVWKYKNVGSNSCRFSKTCGGEPSPPDPRPKDPVPSIVSTEQPTLNPTTGRIEIPVVDCRDVDDPNAPVHKYSYDFIFMDGTRVVGTSDKNTIAVNVASAEFDLHISCSDDFINGYGNKGGPSPNVTPPQLPVHKWKVWKYKNIESGSCELSKKCGGSFTPAKPSNCPTEVPSSIPSPIPSGAPTPLPTAAPSGKPTGEPTGIPSSIPSGNPTSNPSSAPSSVPSSEPTEVPTAQPSPTPTAAPSGKPTGEPTGIPSSFPSGNPTSIPSSAPVSAPSGNPTGVPTAQPSPKPTAAPSGNPTGEPTAIPTSHPTRFCVALDDPNSLQHKYSYDFHFAEGTRIVGTSDDNVITVNVANAVFDLHVSCSDDFEDGYGEKDGPKAGQVPVQYPVSEFKIWKYKNIDSESCYLKGVCSGIVTEPGDDRSSDDPSRKTPKNKPAKIESFRNL